MTSDERRRYFRINETVGLSIHVLSDDGDSNDKAKQVSDTADLIAQHDGEIEALLIDLKDENPKLTQLVSLINQKIERLSRLFTMESSLVDRIAHRIQEVNISACGLAFGHENFIPEGSRLRVEMVMYPDEVEIMSEAIVVSCEEHTGGKHKYYCRVNFYGMSTLSQEELIQRIVKSQSAQLKSRRSQYI